MQIEHGKNKYMRPEYGFCRCPYFPGYLCMWSNEMIFGTTHSWAVLYGFPYFPGSGLTGSTVNKNLTLQIVLIYQNKPLQTAGLKQSN